MARHFTAGIENMMREAELEEMEKAWREENARIMARFPSDGDYPGGEPAAAGNVDQPPLPLEAPPAPDDDPRPPAERDLP